MTRERSGTAGAPKEAPARPPLPGGGLSPDRSTAGQITKIVLLGLTVALAAWAAVPLYADRNWTGLGITAAATALIFAVYLSRRRVAAKYLLPGVLLLIAFQIVPVLYTLSTSVTNYSDGHRNGKSDAIAAVEAASVQRTADSVEYRLTIATTGDPATGPLAFLLTDPDGTPLVGTEEGIAELGGVTSTPAGKITEAPGYTILSPAEVNGRGKEVDAFAVPTGRGTGIRSSGLSAAYEGRATRTYDAACDCITDAESGEVFTADDERGSFVADNGDRLLQGWRVNVGFDNFARFLGSPSVSSSFFAILAWNIGFAALTTASVFVLGLVVALTLHTQHRLRGRTAYRLLAILPYAMPSMAMFLLWRDMFNADFGLVNRLLGLQMDWFGDPWTARAAILVVNLWLGFPYMFLVATGALQAIPRELVQAARIDGAGVWQAFRNVTFPLLMVAMTPILIATFAFNFNNFNAVWLTTRGGPFSTDDPLVGSTDLLITYTYRLAFGQTSGEYGYAAAISVFIFLTVSLISVVGLRRSRSLEEVNG